MKYIQVEGDTLPQAYHKALANLYLHGEIAQCPDYNTRILECGMEMVVNNPLKEPMISVCGIYQPKDLQQYILEVKDGILDFMIGQGENAWEYTYHERITDQIPFVVEELQRNMWSRRAVIDVRKTEVDTANDHPACLQHIQFLVRPVKNELKLDMVVMMRSNDAMQATFMNAFGFILGIQKVVADKLGYEVGHYVHRVVSFHAYEKNWKELEHCYNSVLNIWDSETDEVDPYQLTICYDYNNVEGLDNQDKILGKIPEWRPMMEDAMEEINALIQDQKDKYGVK